MWKSYEPNAQSVLRIRIIKFVQAPLKMYSQNYAYCEQWVYFNVFDMIWGGTIKAKRASCPAHPKPPAVATAGPSHDQNRQGGGGDQRKKCLSFSLVPSSDQ